MAQAKRKKRFFDVEMPILKKETHLIAFEIKELEGRFIKYDLTRFLRGKNALITLKVSVKENKATSTPIELKLLPSFIKRMIRKGTNYVEDSLILKSKEAEMIVKPFLISRRKVSRAVKNALRNKAKEELEKYFKDKTTDEIFEDLIKNKLQKELSLKLKKIYPLSLCEIRTIRLIDQKE